MSEIGDAATWLAEFAREAPNKDGMITCRLVTLLPVLDAVARRTEGERVERYARTICLANGVDPDARLHGGALPEWIFYENDARAVMALADVERERERETAAEVDRLAETKTPWSRARASAAAGLCMCHACVRDRGEARVTMHLCPECGNKRCPKASDHRLACTGSNAVGQRGSVF